ncbi:MAG: 2-phospho-L-lactate transferase CofD family protein [Patescibacteria group bacterium]
MVKKLTVCTIGGGSGMPVVNQALLLAGIKHINSIVTTFDSGGDTGRLKTDERGNLLAFSDYWRSLLSLWPSGQQKKFWQEMLGYRDGRGRNFGNSFFAFMSEKSGSLAKVENLFTKLTGAKISGQVIPITLEPSNLRFQTESGKQYQGEHMLDNLRMSADLVKKIWLDPLVKANPRAIKAIEQASLIIVCPGSMYGSAIANLLPTGVREAFARNQSPKILMTNIMSTRNENHGFDQTDYCKIFAKYLKQAHPFQLVLMAKLADLNQKKLRQVLDYYAREHSFPIKFKSAKGIKTELLDLAIIEEANQRLRHSENKLAEFFKTAIPRLVSS